MKTPDYAVSRPRADALIRKAADHWMLRRESGLSGAEAAEFEVWRRADPRHAAAVDAAESAWTLLNRYRREGRGGDLRARVQSVISHRRKRRLVSGLVCAAAASLGLILFLSERVPGSHPSATITVRDNHQSLPDGSVVVLNAGAEISTQFTASTRGVRLIRGEAWFEVAHDARRPFVVLARHLTVRAVGTAFLVRIDSSDIDVLVTEGRVALQHAGPHTSAPADPASVAVGPADPALDPRTHAIAAPMIASTNSIPPLILEAGKRVLVPVAASALSSLDIIETSAADVSLALAWRNQRVEFDGTALADAVAVFNRHNATQIALADSATAAVRLNGVFWTTDPEAFVRALGVSLDIQCSRDASGSLLLKK